MFDIAPSEFLLIALVAIVVIGPKDLPLALRTAGRWVAKMRRMSAHFRSGVEAMIREAELEEMEKKWREQNAAILAQHPAGAVEVAELPPPPQGDAPEADTPAATSTPPSTTPDADDWAAQWAAHSPPAASAEAAVPPPVELPAAEPAPQHPAEPRP